MRDKLASTTFWVTVIAAVGMWLAAMADILPPSWAAALSTASVVAYALSRGLAKYASDIKRGYKTSEFYIAVAQVVIIVCAAVPGAVTDKVAAALVATIAAVYAASRGLAAPGPDDPTTI